MKRGNFMFELKAFFLSTFFIDIYGSFSQDEGSDLFATIKATGRLHFI